MSDAGRHLATQALLVIVARRQSPKVIYFPNQCTKQQVYLLSSDAIYSDVGNDHNSEWNIERR